jgi:hypothetical protein
MSDRYSTSDAALRDAYELSIGALVVPWLRLTGLTDAADLLDDVNPIAPGAVTNALKQAAESAFASTRNADDSVFEQARVQLTERLAGDLPDQYVRAVYDEFADAMSQSRLAERVNVQAQVDDVAEVVMLLWGTADGLSLMEVQGALTVLMGTVFHGLDAQAMSHVDVDAATSMVADAARSQLSAAPAAAREAAGRYFDVNPVWAPDDAVDLAEESSGKGARLLQILKAGNTVGPTHRVQVIDLVTGDVVHSVDTTVASTAGINIHAKRRSGELHDHDVALWFASPDVCHFDCDYCRT